MQVLILHNGNNMGVGVTNNGSTSVLGVEQQSAPLPDPTPSTTNEIVFAAQVVIKPATEPYHAVTKAQLESNGDKTFVFNQFTPSYVWIIPHNLGKYPSVVVTDDHLVQLHGVVHYVSPTEVQIQFSHAVQGTAFCN